MTKVYTSNTKEPKTAKKSPKNSVINSLLNFSKSIEVLQSNRTQDQTVGQVELILN